MYRRQGHRCAVDVTATAATTAVKGTGAAVEMTIDVVTPGDDEEEDNEQQETTGHEEDGRANGRRD